MFSTETCPPYPDEFFLIEQKVIHVCQVFHHEVADIAFLRRGLEVSRRDP